MRKIVLLAALALAAGLPAKAGTAPAITSLCKLLCGNWQSEGDRAVKVVWEFDEPAGMIWGRTRLLSDKGAAPPTDTVVAIGWDRDKKQLWMMQTNAGDLPSIGSAALSADGYSYALQLYGSKESYGAEVKFEGPDSYSEFFHFTMDDGTHGDGASGPFKRIK